MRLLLVLSVLGLFLGTRASIDWREPAPRSFDVRSPVDVCATLNTELVVPDPLGILTAVGIINQCLCLSDLPLFIETNVVGILATTIAGADVVTRILTDLIFGAAPLNCVFPEHSTPACIAEQPSCGFTCTDGFTASSPGDPPACLCDSPSVVCNGLCLASGLCSSAVVTNSKKKRWVGSESCSERGPGWAACGVYGGGSLAWECVHTARDLESCGGCTLALTPYSPIGEDCSALPGVADVACLHGKCTVYRCFSGYRLAPDGHSCVREYSQFDDTEDVLVSV